MPVLRTRFTQWLAWILLTSAAFTIAPQGPFGLFGWMGIIVPLLAGLVPKLGGWRIAASGAALMTATFLAIDDSSWFDFLAPLSAMLIGVSIAPAPHEAAVAVAGVAGANDESVRREFDLALTRELARARRFERPLAVLSLSFAEVRTDLRLLQAAIAPRIQIFCQMFAADGRLLVIVPELDPEASAALEQRIFDGLSELALGPVLLGRAIFPGDGVTAAALVRHADANRQVRGNPEPTGLDTIVTGNGSRAVRSGLSSR